ncbi:putative LPS assembly protein LptD [Spirosoma litoris]
MSQESDLERELNQKSSVPNRLGPSPSKKNSVPSNTVQSTSSDTIRSRPVVASSDSIRFDSLKAIRFQVSKLTPRGIQLANVSLPRSISPAIVRPERVAVIPFKPVYTVAIPQTSPVKKPVIAQIASKSLPSKQMQPGIVSPNVVRPESPIKPNPSKLTQTRRNQAKTTKPGSTTARKPTVSADSSQIAASDSVSADSTQVPDAFKTTVNYQAKDSTIYAADGQTVELFGDASVIYGDISLKADYIRLNYLTNEVYAKGRYDSTAKKLIGRPIFQDGEGKYDAKEIRYNFQSRKGRIQGVITQQGEGNIRGTTVKKDAEDNLYIGKAIYTTCNLATPHFHINASKLKVIHNTQVVAGPFNLVINQIPLPIGLPFGFFPFPKRKEIGVSGIIVPQYGEEPNGRGFYLRDGGYYWAVNENLGLQFKGQIYSRGSWGLGVSSAYNKRYRYSGSVNLQFNRNRSGDRVDTTQKPRSDFSFTWSHSPVPRGRGSFSANVNVSSNSYNQFNSYSTQSYISNVAGSSVQYSRTFGQYVRAGANVRVNQQFGQVNQVTGVRANGKTDVSSDFNFGVNQIAPFALKGGSGRWYESFRVGLDVSGSIGVSNTIKTQLDTTGLGFPVVTGLTTISALQRYQDSLTRVNNLRLGIVAADPTLIAFSFANADRIWQNRVIQARYSIPIGLPNVKLFRYINLTPGISLQGNIYTKKLSQNMAALEENGSIKIDTARGIYASYNFATSVSMNTRFYGTYFLRGKRIEAIRHTIAPSISFSYTPDFTNPAFGQVFTVVGKPGTATNDILMSLPDYRRKLSVFRGIDGASTSSASSSQSAFISFGVVNQLEMKVRTRSDSLGQEFKKIPIFDNFSINGSYNFLAPDYKLSPISVSANTQIFKNISFNFSSTFDPYATKAYGGTAQYYFPTTVTALTPLAYSPSILALRAGQEYTGQQYIRVPNLYAFQAGQGLLRLTNLQAYVSARFAPKQADKKKSSPNASDATMKAINSNPELYVDFNVPWSMNVSYTFGLTKLTPELSQVVQALTLTGDLSLTPKWKITINTGYDFAYQSPTLTTIGINRDLHCWEMAFNWTPYSGNNFRSGNYSFDLRVRSAILQELKLSRRRSFYDRGGF